MGGDSMTDELNVAKASSVVGVLRGNTIYEATENERLALLNENKSLKARIAKLEAENASLEVKCNKLSAAIDTLKG